MGTTEVIKTYLEHEFLNLTLILALNSALKNKKFNFYKKFITLANY